MDSQALAADHQQYLRRVWTSGVGSKGRAPDSETRPHVSDVFLKSDIHGLADLYEARKSSGRALFWLTVLVVSSGCLAYELHRVVRDFQDNPILTTYSLVSQPAGVPFPHVYLCPTNPIHRRTRDDAYVNGDWEEDNVKGLLQAANSSGKTGIFLKKATFTSQFIHLVSHSSSPIGPVQPWVPDDAQDYFAAVGYPSTVFLQQCAFNAETIDCDEVALPVVDANYGKCFLIRTNRTQTLPGVGLTLLLNIDKQDAYPHNRDDHPLYDGVVMSINKEHDVGAWTTTLLEPAKYTKVNLQVKKLNLVERITSTGSLQLCTEAQLGKQRLQVYNSSYTLGTCHLDCVQQAVVGPCHCSLLADKHFLRPSAPPTCTPRQMTHCAYPAITNASAEIGRCAHSCTHPCQLWEYGVQLSSAAMPTDTANGRQRRPPPPPPSLLPLSTPEPRTHVWLLYSGECAASAVLVFIQADFCFERADSGNCTLENQTTVYRYSSSQAKCVAANISTSCSNRNDYFTTETDCYSECIAANGSSLQCSDNGPECVLLEPSAKYYYNAINDECEQFEYSGCGGNLNNFDEAELCQLLCGASSGSGPVLPGAAPSADELPLVQVQMESQWDWRGEGSGSSDLLLVDIAYSALQYIEVTQARRADALPPSEAAVQTSSMTFSTFVSNIGGQVGLWLGASIVTVVKFFIILWPVCIAKAKRLCHFRPRKRKVDACV